MELPTEWNELFDSLRIRRVRFLVVGAHALAAHGRPRATQDLDIFVDRSRANCQRLGHALSDFGYPALAAEWERFTEGNRMATLGREPFRIDLLNEISGVSFADAWRERLMLTIGGRALPFLGRKSLEKNKRASGRAKDLLDLELLAEVSLPRKQPRRRTRSR